MKLGVRSKLFLVSVLLIVIGIGAVGFLLVGDLRSNLESRVEAELEHSARAGAIALQRHRGARDFASLDPMADELGVASGVRFTLIDATGVVRGDSDVALADLNGLENHASRPEIIEAQRATRGSAGRYSKTLSTEMRYVAVTADVDGEVWTVRAARPLSDVEASVATLIKRLIFAALFGLLIAGVMSALASHWMTRVIRELAGKARTIALGKRAAPPTTDKDELTHLAGSLNLLSDQIETTVSELASERAKFATVLESLGEGIVALDSSKAITLVNRTAMELLDLQEEPIGRPLSDTLRIPALVELVESKAGSSVEIELAQDRRLLARATRTSEDDVVIVLHDITEIHRLETVRRDFVANVSHELRTPVSVISANAETLLESSALADRGATKLLSAVHRHSVRMGQLIADLLDLSKIEAGRYELEPEPLDVKTVVTAAASAVAERASAGETTIVIKVDEGVTVSADRAALDQVLVNLLDNAIKYTPAGGTVVVRTRSRDGCVRIEVEDDGPGIAPAQRDRVFERFYRLDPGRARETGGTGLGLSIVRHLVGAMSGNVGVTGGEKGGALFWIDLPA